MEIFKTIKEYPDYSVSNYGNVRNDSNQRILSPSKKTNGYMQINLKTRDGRRKKEYVHRLVALAFVPNPDGLPQVNHIDRIRDNNVSENLEWVTAAENIRKSSLCTPIRVLRTDRTLVGEYPTICDACRELDLWDSNVSVCLYGGRQKTHRGYIFEKTT